VDSNGQSLAYVYGRADLRDAQIAKVLTLDEARRIASNIAKLPSLLGKGDLEGWAVREGYESRSNSPYP
jgi:hypothetical protein